MIVPPSESSPSKGSASLPPQAGTSSGPPPPPPTYQSTQNFSDSEAQFYNHVRPRAPGESAGKRFIKAFIAAVLIWVLLGVFVRSIVEVGYRSGHRYGSGGWVSEWYLGMSHSESDRFHRRRIIWTSPSLAMLRCRNV
jgi:hypothetical protein